MFDDMEEVNTVMCLDNDPPWKGSIFEKMAKFMKTKDAKTKEFLVDDLPDVGGDEKGTGKLKDPADYATDSDDESSLSSSDGSVDSDSDESVIGEDFEEDPNHPLIDRE